MDFKLLTCFPIFWAKHLLMMHFIQDLSLNFYFFLDIYLHGCGSSVDNKRWYHISTSYWVENLQLSFCLSIKNTHDFEWYTKILWPNEMKMLG